MDVSLENRTWWEFIDKDLQELLRESTLLRQTVRGWKEKFLDYSFIVFPVAKAYEGFLKKLFLKLGFITNDEYLGKRFRVGKALNPALEWEIREKESIYDKVANYCGGKDTADCLWNTWRVSRNLLFHWFPNERNMITFEEANERVDAILSAMDIAFKECRMEE